LPVSRTPKERPAVTVSQSMTREADEERVQIHVNAVRVRYFWNPAARTWRVYCPATRSFLGGTSTDLRNSRSDVGDAYSHAAQS
jgi:hypothetical protein